MQLRPEVQELQTLRAENEELKKLQGQGDELAQLRKDNVDLPRLRNEVRQLREEKLTLTRQTQSAQVQVQTAQAQAQAAQSLAQALRTNALSGLTPKGAQDPALALANACINNLRQIDGAKQQWALENRKPATALVNQVELARYFKNNTMPVCPAGGIYTLNTVGLAPICNMPGHALPKQ